jgi:N-acetyl sugar amidotransferase
MDPAVQVCVRCTVDRTVPGAVFDARGECNYCKLHDKLDRQFPLDAQGQRRFRRLVDGIKAAGRGRKFDCVLGISGGRDSTYTLWYTVKVLGLRPLAVHFNDGFGNPVAGENMKTATAKLGVELRTITSDWREGKDLRIAFLKASTPDLECAADIGIATALYGQAARENVRCILIGQSFRTEGIAPLEWNYLDGEYLDVVHRRFGTVKLRKWSPADPGFHLNIRHLFYYTVIRGIRTLPILYYVPYVRSEAETLIRKELDWVYTGAHYYDDLYQSLMFYVHRVKFGIDRRKYNYAALVRSGQMKREDALESFKTPYVIEDPKVIDLCIKRLGLTRAQFDEFMALPPKTFRDYPTQYNLIRKLRVPVWVLSRLRLLPETAYDKYFHCG